MLKVLEKYKLAIIIMLVVDILSLIPLIKRIDYSMITPGGLNEVNDVIEVNNDFDFEGSFNTTFVLSVNKITIYQYIVGIHNEQFIVYENQSTISNKEENISGTISHNAAIEYAIINAYKEANKKNPDIKLEYETSGLIIYYRPDNINNLNIGDKVYDIDGYTKIDLVNYINTLNSDYSNNSKKELTIKFYAYKNNGQDTTIKLTLEEFNKYYKYRTHNFISANPSFEINKTNVGGPSGGLLNTLNIYSNLIQEDMTKGYKIAGTGTISINGSVGAIGGMEQKIYTAQKNKVDYFIVPYSDDTSSVEYQNYVESMNAYKKIKNPTFKIIPVRNLVEAIQALEGLQ